jgi:hypothetical protein
VLNNWGFKACYSVGLSIYACGTLIFWPSAVLTSYAAYLITNIFVGFGLSILEVAANPFVALCGPPQYAEVRLLLSQAIQAVGTVIAPLIAKRAFVTKHYDANIPSLVDTQYAYLGIALFTVLLAVVYHYVPLPEATTAELEDASERMDGANKAKIKSVPVIWIILGLAAFSQFCYVGAQEVNGTVFDNYLAAVVGTDLNASNYMAVAHTCFAVSRFISDTLLLCWSSHLPSSRHAPERSRRLSNDFDGVLHGRSIVPAHFRSRSAWHGQAHQIRQRGHHIGHFRRRCLLSDQQPPRKPPAETSICFDRWRSSFWSWTDYADRSQRARQSEARDRPHVLVRGCERRQT